MSDTEDLEMLLASLVVLLPFEDAAAASLGAPFDVEALVSSSVRAATLDEVQRDLGEGPGWDAFRAHRPIQSSVGVPQGEATAWPFLASSLVSAGVHSVLALPITFGPLHIGAVTLFTTRSEHASAEAVQVAESVVTLLGRAVIARALAEAQSGAAVRDASLARREVHQATGMVLSQTGTSAADALLILRAYAFSTSRTLREVAADVVSRRLDLSPDSDH